MHRRLLLPAFLLALTATGAGCSDDPEPIIEPAPSSPAASPAASESTPDAEPEPESAKAFIRRWQEETYAMQDSGRIDAYLGMTRGCSSCRALAEGVEKIYSNGGSVETTGGRVAKIERVGKSNETLVFEYVAISGASKVLDSKGQVTERYAGGLSRFQINLVKRANRWEVRRVSRLET